MYFGLNDVTGTDKQTVEGLKYRDQDFIKKDSDDSQKINNDLILHNESDKVSFEIWRDDQEHNVEKSEIYMDSEPVSGTKGTFDYALSISKGGKLSIGAAVGVNVPFLVEGVNALIATARNLNVFRYDEIINLLKKSEVNITTDGTDTIITCPVHGFTRLMARGPSVGTIKSIKVVFPNLSQYNEVVLCEEDSNYSFEPISYLGYQVFPKLNCNQSANGVSGDGTSLNALLSGYNVLTDSYEIPGYLKITLENANLSGAIYI